jgi:hypothetical protein
VFVKDGFLFLIQIGKKKDTMKLLFVGFYCTTNMLVQKMAFFCVATPLWAKCEDETSKVGTWSPPGLPKIQSLITGVKTPCIGVFFIPLERS